MRVIIEVGPEQIAGASFHAVRREYKATYASQAKKVPEDQGRACWAALHQCAEPSTEWLAAWEETIPRYNCGGGCRKFYLDWKAINPPRFDDFFAWTVELHNAVNTKLDKPSMTFEDAKAVWNR